MLVFSIVFESKMDGRAGLGALRWAWRSIGRKPTRRRPIKPANTITASPKNLADLQAMEAKFKTVHRKSPADGRRRAGRVRRAEAAWSSPRMVM